MNAKVEGKIKNKDNSYVINGNGYMENYGQNFLINGYGFKLIILRILTLH